MSAAPIKISQGFAALAIADLPAWIAEAKADGIEPPTLALGQPDRLTQADARALYAWGLPQVLPALRNSAHPGNAAARAFVALTNHFGADHPQANGEPEPWPAPMSPALAALLAGARDTIEARDLTPAEAQDFLAWNDINPDHIAATVDKGAPGHVDIARERQELHAVAYRDGGAGEPETTTTGGTTMPIDRATQARIDELSMNPAWRDGRHPDHRRVVDEITRLYEQGVAGTAGGASSTPGTAAASGSSPDEKSPAQRLAEVEQNPGYRDGRHPKHGDLVSQASAIYGELAAAAGDGEAA